MVLDLILIALAITLDPLPLSAFMLMLSSPDGGTKRGLGFCVGWVASLVAIVAVTVTLTGGTPLVAHTAPAQASLIVRIVVGVLLLVVAWTRHRARERPRRTPAWMARVDRLGVASAAVIAVVLEPWALMIAGAATIAGADLTKTSSLVAIAVYCVLCASTYLVMLGFVILSPERARKQLGNLRAWIEGHRNTLIVGVSLILGLWLIGKSSYLLVE